MIESRVPYETLRDNLRTVEPAAPLGKEYAYQNVVYSLIGDIIQKVTGKPYGEVLKEKVFDPLHLTDASTSFESLEHGSNVALPHYKRSDSTFYAFRNTPEYYTVLPAAGVNASISDMAKWLQALLGNNQDVISSATLNELFKPEVQVPRRRKYHFFKWKSIRETYYGMGLRVLSYGGETVIYHGGFVNGYRSEIGFCPSQKIGIVILCNASGKLVNESVPVFFDAYFNHQPKPEIKKAGI
jgi:beta-lactamase class C